MTPCWERSNTSPLTWNVPLVVVLGHTRCGAVSAAVENARTAGRLRTLIDILRPAVEASRNRPGDRVDNAARENVIRQVERLRRTGPTLAELYDARRLQVVGAMYDIRTGIVEWLHP